jgi:hypothetical protein
MQDENNSMDLLQIKIDEAKAQLPKETANAINAVDYKAVILEMRQSKGYTFEQLGDLETETELLLCGLVSPENYSKELENRMHLPKNQVNELIKEMNEKVFAKIKENLIKGTGGDTEKKNDTQILNSAGIEIIPDLPAIPSTKMIQVEKPELTTSTPPVLVQKLSGSLKVPMVKTEHSLENITRASGESSQSNVQKEVPKSGYTVDPYRMPPEA